MAKERLTGRVSYRLGTEAFKQVQRKAAAEGVSPNDWCREAVTEKLQSRNEAEPNREMLVSEASRDQAPTLIDRIMVQEIMRLRWLIQHGMSHYLKKRESMAVDEWQYLIEQANGDGQFKETLRKWLESYGVKAKI